MAEKGKRRKGLGCIVSVRRMAEKVRRWLRKGGVSAPLRDNPDYEDEQDEQEDYGSWEDVFEQEV